MSYKAFLLMLSIGLGTLFGYPQNNTKVIVIEKTKIILKNKVWEKGRERPYFFPVDTIYSIGSRDFGMHMHPILKKMKFHRGIDIVAPKGATAYASASGKVVRTKYCVHCPSGNSIYIQHDDSTFLTKYFHLSKIMVEAGQRVITGDTIGLVGSTGRSTTPHLHFEIWKGNQPIDPKIFIQ